MCDVLNVAATKCLSRPQELSERMLNTCKRRGISALFVVHYFKVLEHALYCSSVLMAAFDTRGNKVLTSRTQHCSQLLLYRHVKEDTHTVHVSMLVVKGSNVPVKEEENATTNKM